MLSPTTSMAAISVNRQASPGPVSSPISSTGTRYPAASMNRSASSGPVPASSCLKKT